jgi:hypothetical protein
MKIILPILLLFIVLAVLSAHVNLPGTDEAWFASPALNLITSRALPHLGAGPHRRFSEEQPDRHRPPHLLDCAVVPLVQAAWDRVAGFGLMHVRYFSALWGLVAMWAWYRILMIVSGDRRVAILALG